MAADSNLPAVLDTAGVARFVGWLRSTPVALALAGVTTGGFAAAAGLATDAALHNEAFAVAAGLSVVRGAFGLYRRTAYLRTREDDNTDD